MKVRRRFLIRLHDDQIATNPQVCCCGYCRCCYAREYSVLDRIRYYDTMPDNDQRRRTIKIKIKMGSRLACSTTAHHLSWHVCQRDPLGEAGVFWIPPCVQCKRRLKMQIEIASLEWWDGQIAIVSVDFPVLVSKCQLGFPLCLPLASPFQISRVHPWFPTFQVCLSHHYQGDRKSVV